MAYIPAGVSLVIHHLSCGQMSPPFGSLVHGRSRFRHLVCHCLLIEAGGELVLVDSGVGRHDIANPRERLGFEFLKVVRPRLEDELTAVAQIEARGFDPRAVRHIVLTHMDVDHAGGLSDFPEARVHVMRTELQQARRRPTRGDRSRYRPAQWQHDVKWEEHEVAGERWHDFEAVRDLPGLPPEILLVPTVGHSAGHAAVGIQTADGWLLHCGDAYFHRDEVNPEKPGCTPGLQLFQWLVAYERRTRLRNRDRLRELAGSAADVKLFSAHDPVEFSRF